ncbi:MAG: carbohydrate ABC transporter permease [Ruminococcaceae bacterium]|nr:carbohydrate ABC transporter permease [Oscillospiraceae bacterium]
MKLLKRKTLPEILIYSFVSLLFAAVAFSYLYILFWAIMSGAKTHDEIVMNPFSFPSKWMWEHFVEVTKVLEVNGHNFFEMLFNSCYFSIVGCLLQQFTTVTFAYCCTKYKFPGSELPYVIILIMMTLPIYGAGGAQYKLFRSLGLVDSYWHVICSAGGMSAQFLYYRAFFKNLSWTYAEAAQIDGAGHFQIYFKVMLPQARPIFGALFLTSWLASWNNYESALLYLPNLPTLPVGIYQFNVEMMYRARLDILFAACVLVSIPALVLFIAFNKVITTNVSLGGIKG